MSLSEDLIKRSINEKATRSMKGMGISLAGVFVIAGGIYFLGGGRRSRRELKENLKRDEKEFLKHGIGFRDKNRQKITVIRREPK